MSFVRDKVLSNDLKNWNGLPFDELLKVLGLITHRVTLSITAPETHSKKVQLTCSVPDALEIFGGEVPSESNFARVFRRFMDRKNHGPTPAPSPPAEKSFGAQGQTKKPGSHSDGRHG